MKLLKMSVYVLAAALLPLTACNDKEKTPEYFDFSVADEAVDFGLEGGSLTVNVSIGDSWSSTCPDWVSVTPDNGGAGEFEVTVSAKSNFTGEKPGTPRYGNIVLTEVSGDQITISVSQDGCWETTIADLADWDDGTSVYLSGLTVVTLFPDGFIAAVSETSSDTSTNLWVLGSESVNVGDGLSVYGKKYSTNSLPIIIEDSCSLLSSGNAVEEAEPTDLTGQLDSYEFSQWEYVTMTGIINDDMSVTFLDDAAMAVISNTVEGLEVRSSWYATLTGYYAGASSNRVTFYITDIDYIGAMYSKVLFEEDWDWLEKFESSLSSSGKDSVASKSEPGTNRIDAADWARSDGVRMINYVIDTLKYTVYTDEYGTQYTNRVGYTPMWACIGTYYFGCSNERGKVFLVPPKFEIPKGDVLSVRLTFDVSRRNSRSDEAVRFETLTEDMTGVNEYIIDISGNDIWTWITYTIDMTDVDWEKSPRFGFGSDNWVYTVGIDQFFYIDNIRLTWIGTVDE